MTNDPALALATGLHQIADVARQLLDACDGYRAECVSRGYSSGVVDSMVSDYHRALVAMVLGQFARPSS